MPRTRQRGERPTSREGEDPAETGTGSDSEIGSAMTVECVCGRPVELQALEGYAVPTFVGGCPCGRVWSLSELSAQMAEPEA